jgi:hypothetical protein
MRSNPTKRIEQYRVTTGRMASDASFGANGAFYILCRETGAQLAVIASDGTVWEECGLPLPKWEHVSVSLASRTPTWVEMQFVKRIFWRDDECVVQFHPTSDRYVNVHPYCLHMWKPIGVEMPVPPVEAVGPLAGVNHGR